MTDPKMTGTKTCSKCEKDLPVICFAVMKTSKDGLRPNCRDCTSKYRKEHKKQTGFKEKLGTRTIQYNDGTIE